MRFALYLLLAVNAILAVVMTVYAVRDFAAGNTGSAALDLVLVAVNVVVGLVNLHTLSET